MKKLSVVALAAVFALGLAGCKGGGDEKKEDKAPACDKVCEHAYGVELASASEAEKKDYEQEKDEYFKDCNEACGSEMDDDAKKCVMAAKAKDDLKTCKKESRKRRKAAKADKGSEEKSEKK
ncbi:MAG: hypothetical protein ABIK09_07695 [Pseudomonadota bacterium]